MKHLLICTFLSISPKTQAADDRCFSRLDVEILSSGLRQLEVCKFELKQKSMLVEKLTKIDPPTVAWWQDPTFVFGGMVVSISVGALVGAYVLQKK